MKEEIKIFFTAVMFYTRIPCPSWVNHSAQYINKATRYFPLIGWIVGGISAFTFFLLSPFFGLNIGILFSMIVSIWVTGAFHEDGFADACDGFGGGWTKEKILEIMKDSRLGTYGTIGLISIFLLKFFLLHSIIETIHYEPVYILISFILAHSLSRFIASTFIFTHPYAQDDAKSKVKPVAIAPEIKNLWIGSIWVLIPLSIFCLLTQSAWLMLILFPVYGLKMYLATMFSKKIGGYTGDCLGATQQVCEITFYMSFIIIWKFIL